MEAGASVLAPDCEGVGTVFFSVIVRSAGRCSVDLILLGARAGFLLIRLQALHTSRYPRQSLAQFLNRDLSDLTIFQIRLDRKCTGIL
jgi:hypothetical protein